MNEQTVSKINARSATKAGLAAAIAVTGFVALAGCEQHPYPTPAPDESAPAQPAPNALMGAPEGPGGPPPVGPNGEPISPQAYPPGQQPYPGAPGSEPQFAQSPPGPVYPQGGMIEGPNFTGPHPPCPPDASQHGPNAPAVIICSAPVPNPPEDEAYAHRWRHRRHDRFASHWEQGEPGLYHFHHHHSAWRRYAAEQASGSGYVYHHGHRYWIEGTAAPAPFTGRHAYSTYHRHRRRLAGPIAAAPAAHPTPPAALAKPHKSRLHPKASPRAGAASTMSAGGGANTTGANTTGPSSESANSTASSAASATPAQRYAALQTALTSTVASGAKLNAPSHFNPGQAAEVTLTLPADLAQTVRTEAAKQDLSDQAASVNFNAALSGDGYTFAPDQPQSQPLTLGQATVFHWKVTAQPNVRGPLQALVNADFLSDGKTLALGAVTPSSGWWTGRVIGVGLLVLIALVLLGWAAQRRKPKAATGAVRPRESHQNGN